MILLWIRGIVTSSKSCFKLMHSIHASMSIWFSFQTNQFKTEAFVLIILCKVYSSLVLLVLRKVLLTIQYCLESKPKWFQKFEQSLKAKYEIKPILCLLSHLIKAWFYFIFKRPKCVWVNKCVWHLFEYKIYCTKILKSFGIKQIWIEVWKPF